MARNILDIRERLQATGHRCTIITTSVSTSVVHDPSVMRPSSAIELLKMLRKIDCDVVHLHIGGDITARVLRLMLAVATFAKAPAILTIHSGGYVHPPEAAAARPGTIRGLILRRYGHVIAVNQALQSVLRRYGLEDERISVVPPYILRPPDRSVLLSGEIAEFASRSSPLLVAVGGLEKDYEPHFLVKAMASIREVFPNAGLVIVGDGSLRESVAAAVAETGSPVMLAGDLPHGATLRLIAESDAMIRATLFDGDAISVREAIHLGMPVVATANGMRPKGVFTFPVGDETAFVKAVKQAIAGHRQVSCDAVADYTNADRILGIYDSVITQRSGSR